MDRLMTFYLRPKMAIKAIKKIKNMEMLKSYIAGFFRLFKLKANNKK